MHLDQISKTFGVSRNVLDAAIALISVLSLIFTCGIWYASVRTHIHDERIHETAQAKRARVKEIIADTIKPTLERHTTQLDAIQSSVRTIEIQLARTAE